MSVIEEIGHAKFPIASPLCITVDLRVIKRYNISCLFMKSSRYVPIEQSLQRNVFFGMSLIQGDWSEHFIKGGN